MISAWTKHIKDESEKERFNNELLGSKRVLDRLGALLQEVEGDLDNTEMNPKIYDLPNWDYRQAHTNGYRACLKTIKKLITLDQQDKQ